MKTSRVSLAGLLVLSLFGLVTAAGQVSINGSTTVHPIAVEIQNWFLNNNPDVLIDISATGSGDGIAALINGECDIAMHSREMKTSEYGKAVEAGVFPVIYTVALDKIAVAVNASNPVDNLTMEQLYGIYMGTITHWSEVGGSNTPILVGSRDSSSGTFGVWKELVLEDQDYEATNVTVVASNSVMQETVASEPNAIGYVGLAYTTGVKIITVEGQTTDSAAYALARKLFISTNGQPQGDVAVVVNAFLGTVGQCAAQLHKYIPIWACDCGCEGVLD